MSKRSHALKQIGPYRVLRELGVGGAARVFEVEAEDTHKRYALKLLSRQGVAITRFHREYRALARLDHPNIVRVYRYDESDKGPYLLMELLDGVLLQERARDFGEPGTTRRTAEVARLVAGVADALDYLHQRRIIHRDLKSSNVIVLKDGSVKLLDFGTARVLDSGSQITRMGEFVGTFAYASPEQIDGDSIDERSDIYSLGALLYRLLCGRPPFEADTAFGLARKHLMEMPPAPHELVPGLPVAVSDLVMRMMAKAPGDRVQSAGEVAELLREHGGASLPVGGALEHLGQPVLVGRRTVLRRVAATLGRARPGRMTLLVGGVGSDRARVLGEAAALARREGFGTCSASLHSMAAPRDSVDCEGTDGHINTRVLSELLGKLLDAAGTVRTAVFLHDLHLASPPLVAAVQDMLTQATTRRVPLLLFATALDLADGPALRLAFFSATRSFLQPLTPGEVGVLVGSMLGWRSTPAAFALELARASGGQPVYVAEILRAMVRSGGLEACREPGGLLTWVDSSGGRISIPPAVEREVSAQLLALDPHSTGLLQAVALAGDTALLLVLVHAAGLESTAVQASLAMLEQLGVLLPADERGCWRFRVGMVADVVVGNLSVERRAELEGRLAEVLPLESPSVDAARLLSAAGSVDDSIREIVRCFTQQDKGRHAASWLAVTTSITARVADARAVSQAALARLFLAHACALSSHHPGDRRVDLAMRKARAFATEPTLRAEVDMNQALYLRSQGRRREERDLLQQARWQLERLRPTPGGAGARERMLARLLQELGTSSWCWGEIPRSVQLYERAIQAAGAVEDPRCEGRARVGHGVVLAARGQLAEAEQQLLRGRACLRVAGDRDGGWVAAIELAHLVRIDGRLSESLSLLEPYLQKARLEGDPHVYTAMLLALTELEVDLYRLGQARERLGEVLELGVAQVHPLNAARVALARGRLALATGETEAAVAILEQSVAAAERALLPLVALQLEAYKGEAMAAHGDWRGAGEHTRRAIDQLGHKGWITAQAFACACRSRALGEREDPAVSFGPVLDWLESHGAATLRMEYLLVRAEYYGARGVSRQAYHYQSEARRQYAAISNQLSPAEQHAFSMHPWRRRVEQVEGGQGARGRRR